MSCARTGLAGETLGQEGVREEVREGVRDTTETESDTTSNSMTLNMNDIDALAYNNNGNSNILYAIKGNNVTQIENNVSISWVKKMSFGYLISLKETTAVNGVQTSFFYIKKSNSQVLDVGSLSSCARSGYYENENENGDVLFDCGVFKLGTATFENYPDGISVNDSSNNFAVDISNPNKLIDIRTMNRINTDSYWVLALNNNQFIWDDYIRSSTTNIIQANVDGFEEINVTVNDLSNGNHYLWDERYYNGEGRSFIITDSTLYRFQLSSDKTTLTITDLELANSSQDNVRVTMSESDIVIQKSRSLSHYVLSPALALAETIESDINILSVTISGNTAYYLKENIQGAKTLIAYNLETKEKTDLEFSTSDNTNRIR
tara:strand:- start:546 stop:1673 length:1128 start_codon:yes stop_codon:yes gene_type:complete